LDNSGCKKE